MLSLSRSTSSRKLHGKTVDSIREIDKNLDCSLCLHWTENLKNMPNLTFSDGVSRDITMLSYLVPISSSIAKGAKDRLYLMVREHLSVFGMSVCNCLVSDVI